MISSDPQAEEWPSLFEPDGRGPWAVRYNWIKHDNNEEFLANYFAAGSSELKLNLRNSTKHLAHLWKPHNDTIAKGQMSGDLIFRIKTLNHVNRSIDHIEVWKSRDIIENYFHIDDSIWADEDKEELETQVRAAGFIICPVLRPYPLISKSQALSIYTQYLKKAMNRDFTRIEAPLKYV